MATHRLKTWPEQFEEVKKGHKTFEWRKADRDFRQGDLLLLQKFDPSRNSYLGEEILVSVSHVLNDGFGVPEGYCILSIKNPVYYCSPDKALYLASIIEEKLPVSMTEAIPIKEENPEGLHQRYAVRKIKRWKKNKNGTFYPECHQYNLDAQYFVLRLDDKGGDQEWVKACRKAMLTLGEEIRDHLPELSKDIFSRYKPLNSDK